MNRNTKPLKPEEIPSHVRINLKSQRLCYDGNRKKGYLIIDYTCLKCERTITASVGSLRYKFRNGNFSGCCIKCHPRFRPTKPNNGISIRGGYRWIHTDNVELKLLKAILEAGAKIAARNYLSEHRIIAFQKYGPIVYRPGIMVRHLDGDKLNNSLDNLAIGTNQDNVDDHMTSRRKVARWHSLAIDILKLIHQK